MFLFPNGRARFAVAVACWLASLVAGPLSAGAVAPGSLTYVSPLPKAKSVLPETNVIVRPGGILDVASVRTASGDGRDATITVEG